MNRPIDSLTILTIALRSRCASVPQLVELTGATIEQVTSAVAELAELGFLSLTNDVITYRRPDVAIADRAERALGQARQELDSSLSQTQHILGTLPGLLQAWDLGQTEEHSLQFDVLHGPYAAADIWRLQYSREVPLSSDVMMPDTAPLFANKAEYDSSFWATRAGEDIKVRLIMSTADASHPAARERVQGEIDNGVQIRMHPKPPSWLWITDGDTIGMPLHWGQAWPTSVMATRSAPIAAVFNWIFERVWEESVPVGEASQTWDPILRLMSEGMTMAMATQALGLAPRTGRRRVADAMAHYGTDTPFSLGAAWARTHGA